MTVIGLTGPTGAGKSTVAAHWQRRGALIIDADVLAREVTAPGHPCLQALAKRFGDDILKDGILNRRLLAARAFATPETTQALNDITHPPVIARTEELLRSCTAPVAVIDAPLLFESGMDRLCDITVAVTAPTAVRRARIMARDGISQAQADQRIAAQHDEAYFRERATICVDNGGDEAATLAAVDALLKGVV